MTEKIYTQEMTLEQKLAAIEQAVQEASGDPQKEIKNLESIVDPQDSLNCEGCQ